MSFNPLLFSLSGTALLGILFFLILVARYYQLNEEKRLSHHRKRDEGVADLLNYGSVIENGIILCKNGSLMASWIYKAADSASSTKERKESASIQLNKAMHALGNGWMLHVDSIRVEAQKYSDRNLSHFPDPITLAIDEERRRLFEKQGNMYEGCYVLTVTYFPPLLAQEKFVELLFDDDNKKNDTNSRTSGILKDFKKNITTLESNLSPVLTLTRLKGKKYEYEDGSILIHDEQLQYLHYCLTGIVQPIVLPENPTYIDRLIGGQELWGGVIPKIGTKFIQVVGVDGFPLESCPGMLNILADVPIVCRFSSRFIFMDRHQAEAATIKFQKKWSQKQRGFADQLFNRPTPPERMNKDAVNMVRDAGEALKEINEGLVAFGYYTGVVILMDDDRSRLEASTQDVVKSINKLGFTARIETINTMDAFMGSLPGHGVENVRRPFMHTLNFADLLPMSSIWTGENQAPCPFYPPLSPPLMHCVTTGSTPYRLNLHVGDLGHTLVVGRTGGGKSTLLASLIAQARRYQGSTVFAFDVGHSLFPLCTASGGTHFDIASDVSTLSFAPFQFLETSSDKAWGLEWVEKILALNGVTISPGERNEVAETLERLAHQHREGLPVSMTDFVSQVQSIRIREVMQQYSLDGLMRDLLAAKEDKLTLSDLTVFEVSRLMELGDKWSLPVLHYIFRRIERSLHGQPAWLFLDEAWLMLQHPTFSQQIRAWLKTLRKMNCAVVMATQNLDDFAKSTIFSDVVESTASKIFLPNLYARNEDTANIYRRMGLNSQQIKIIAGATPKRQYYHSTEQGNRLFDLALGPIALSFVAVNDRESIAAIKKMQEKFGEKWPEVWLKGKTGIDLETFMAA